jgi:hypothetical protein
MRRGAIPVLDHPCILSISRAVCLYCRRFAFAFMDDLEIELDVAFTGQVAS